MEIANQINSESLSIFFNFLNELPTHKFIIFLIFIVVICFIICYFKYKEKKEAKEEYITLLKNKNLELEKENKELKNLVKK